MVFGIGSVILGDWFMKTASAAEARRLTDGVWTGPKWTRFGASLAEVLGARLGPSDAPCPFEHGRAFHRRGPGRRGLALARTHRRYGRSNHGRASAVSHSVEPQGGLPVHRGGRGKS